MKVLVVSPDPPYPPDRGSNIRIYHSVARLLRYHTVQGLAFKEEGGRQENLTSSEDQVCDTFEFHGEPAGKLKSAAQCVLKAVTYRRAKFDDPKFRRRLREMVDDEEFDLVWVHFLNVLGLLYDTGVLEELNGVPIVLDQHNDMERFWVPEKGHGNIFDWGWARWNEWNVRRLRRKVLRYCHAILSVSPEDARSTREVAPANVPVWRVPNGVDLSRFEDIQWKSSDPNRLLFVGSMDVRMNVDAVTWFVGSIFPKIRDQIPDVRFDIVGRSPAPEVQALGKEDGVRVTGRVEDVRPYYEQATVAVVPFRFGGGTKLKVPEAMAAEVPVVSTSVGAQGLDVESGRHLRIADEEGAFARAVTELLKHPDEARRVAQSAKVRAKERYSWSGIYDAAIKRIEDMVATDA